MKIILGFFQVNTSFATTFSIEFPFEYSTFMAYFSFTSFDILPAFSLGCIVDDSFYSQLLAMTCLPVAIVAGLLAVGLLSYLKDKALNAAISAKNSMLGKDEGAGLIESPGAETFNLVQDLILKLTFLIYPGNLSNIHLRARTVPPFWDL